MAGDTPLTMPVKAQRGITLRHAARRFAACAKGDDVHVEDFAEATEQMMTIVERFGSFTKRGAPRAPHPNPNPSPHANANVTPNRYPMITIVERVGCFSPREAALSLTSPSSSPSPQAESSP